MEIDGVTLRPVYERTDLVEKTVETAVRVLIEGSILVAIVLFLFLGEIRSAIVVITALPLAMLIAFIFMREAGLSANLMSLAGLAVGIGCLADYAAGQLPLMCVFAREEADVRSAIAEWDTKWLALSGCDIYIALTG